MKYGIIIYFVVTQSQHSKQENTRKFFYYVTSGHYKFLSDDIDEYGYCLDQKMVALIGSGRYTSVVSIKIPLISLD